MEGLPPNIIPSLITVVQVVIVAVVAQFGASWIQGQRRREAREGKELDLYDRREDRVTKESDNLRAEMRTEIALLRQENIRMRDETETCKRDKLEQDFQLRMLRWEINQLRASSGLPPVPEPPPASPSKPITNVPPTLPPTDQTSGAPPAVPPPTTDPEPPRRPPPRH